ncbi:fatty acid desaturase [cf. Phormidesmis sp. LEGE 11477]|uniref:fatty acid desaturase n=1 Tax=cf. Phormidesmis sp. LEGE 11477 TaxID=1828680 RepID=UPI001D159DAD|nr:fatty acid desaturase [cf. Phormidesmis sp. LEGE 11477]
MLESALTSESSDSVNPRQLLTASVLEPLNRRSNLAGAVRFGAHLAIVAASGWGWAQASGLWQVPFLIIYGVSLAFMFCAVHECVHRTAFASARVNDAIAWLAGLLSFYNSTFYRRYHKWHHRYTRIAGKDPELTDLEPKTVPEYLWVLSGIPWWKGKIVGHIKVALGQFEGCFYLPESAYDSVIRSIRLQLVAYGAIALFTTALGHPWFLFTYWILPLAVGQPFLRFALLAEHTGCTYDDNPLANTRTTLTLWPLRLLMWNMPYHAEHHLYPSIPFHALPKAHTVLKEKFETVDTGYVKVNKEIVQSMG